MSDTIGGWSTPRVAQHAESTLSPVTRCLVMKSPGERVPPNLQPSAEPASAAELLQLGRAHERTGAMNDAVHCYTAAIEAAERTGERGVLAEALRRLGVVHHHRNEAETARSLCQRSYETGLAMGDSV